MKLSNLIQQLVAIHDQHGDLPVLKEDDNGSIYELSRVSYETAEEDEYPKDWDMPAGFQFVLVHG